MYDRQRPELYCCARCHHPPTTEDFLANHLTPKPSATRTHTVAEHDVDHECAICRLPYGSENLAVMQVDHPYQVTGHRTCNHTFGRACIEQLFRVSDNGYLRCPLCRAYWCWVFGLWNGVQDPISLQEYYVEKQQLIHSRDFWTTMDYVYPADMDVRAEASRKHSYWQLNHESTFRWVTRRELERPEFVERIAKLQEQCKATLKNPGFDPWDPSALLMVSVENPLAYTNWHALRETLVQAIFYAACRSPRGERICDVIYEVYYSDTSSLNEEELKQKAFNAAKDDWRVVWDDGDEEDFIDMLLEMTWAYGEYVRQEVDGSPDTASESSGGEEGQEENSEEQVEHKEASEGVVGRLEALGEGQEQTELSKGGEQREEVVEKDGERGQAEQ